METGKPTDSKIVAPESTSRPRSIEFIDTADECADAALNFVEKHEGFTYSAEQDKAVLRKIDRHLMPLLFTSFLVQYMDKSLMAQSIVYGIRENLHLKGQEYSWCGSIFFFGYLVVQPVGGRFLNYIPLGKFVIGASIAWAIVVFCTAGATNFSGLMAARFFLGVAEGGISPAFVLLTGMWYKKEEIPQRTTIWFTANGLAIILQAVVSYGIGHIDNTSVPVWKWFFIIFGIMGLVWAAVLYCYMMDSPLTAKFLNEEEKVIAIERLRENRTGITNREFKRHQFFEALKDPVVYYHFFYNISIIVLNSGVSFFGSLIIKGFGYSSFVSSLLQMPYGGVMLLGLPAAGYMSSKYPNSRCFCQVACVLPAVIGAALMFYLPSHNKAGRLTGYYLTAFSNGAVPLQFSLLNSNTAGHTKRSVANAIMFLGYATGFIIGPQFFLTSEAPIYPTGFKAMLITFTIATTTPLGLYCYLTWLNKRKEALMIASGGENVYERNEEFLDHTDKEQIHFRYSK